MFLYRDAKQYTGLNDCQDRSESKIHFHQKASLSAVNIAKAKHWINRHKDKEDRESFISMVFTGSILFWILLYSRLYLIIKRFFL